jgi:hypothetical protein
MLLNECVDERAFPSLDLPDDRNSAGLSIEQPQALAHQIDFVSTKYGLEAASCLLQFRLNCLEPGAHTRSGRPAVAASSCAIHLVQAIAIVARLPH